MGKTHLLLRGLLPQPDVNVIMSHRGWESPMNGAARPQTLPPKNASSPRKFPPESQQEHVKPSSEEGGKPPTVF